jgi:hypothetical protein
VQVFDARGEDSADLRSRVKHILGMDDLRNQDLKAKAARYLTPITTGTCFGFCSVSAASSSENKEPYWVTVVRKEVVASSCPPPPPLLPPLLQKSSCKHI